MDALLTSLNLAVQQGIDPDPDNAVAVATFAYQDAAGNPQQVWPLHRCAIFCNLPFLLSLGFAVHLPWPVLHVKHLSLKPGPPTRHFPVRGTCGAASGDKLGVPVHS